MDLKKMAPYLIGVALVFGGGGFYGGMKYAAAKSSFRGGARAGQFAAGTTAGGQQAGGSQAGGRLGNAAFRVGGFVSGEILSNDGKTMTVKLADGGSKIIFLSDSTEISKFASGEASDLEVGKNVMVTGKTNDDGSVTAQSIQLRPDGMAFPGGTGAPAGGRMGGMPQGGATTTPPANQ